MFQKMAIFNIANPLSADRTHEGRKNAQLDVDPTPVSLSVAGKKKYTLSKHHPTVPMSVAEAAMTTASKTTTKTELTPFADAFSSIER